MVLAVEGIPARQLHKSLDFNYRNYWAMEIHRTPVMQKTGASNLPELARTTGCVYAKPTKRWLHDTQSQALDYIIRQVLDCLNATLKDE